MNTALWEPFDLSGLPLAHRLAMAPMTRSRAQADGTPGTSAATYYAERAGLGLLITEGVQPSDDGQGYMMTPGIYTAAHIEGWRAVTEAVHANGGSIFFQLMHAGRVAHSDNTPHGRAPLAPSAISAGMDLYTASGPQPTDEPLEMTAADIQQTIADFRHAAASAVAAGADGVEIHGANGYLIHQFLSPNSNLRTDGYGGTIENRARLAVEIVTAIVEEIGADRVGVRLSPGLAIAGIDEGAGVHEQYGYLVKALAPLGLAYLHLFHVGDDDLLRTIRAEWPTALLVNRYGRTVETLGSDIEAGLADIEPVGRLALANPDLIERLQGEHPLNEADPATFYSGGDEGYVDYPTMR